MGKTLSKKAEILWFLGVALFFVLLHFPALHHPLHQDEYKWPIIVNPALTEPGGIPHPPVGEFIYRQAGFIVGYENFRFVPFFFGILNIFLIFHLAKIIFESRTALWVAGFFALSFYSLLASLMVDTDGAIMPFFFLVALFSYYKLRLKNFNLEKGQYLWIGILALSSMLGFLTKTSFFIGILALILDFAIEKKIFSDKKKFLKHSIYSVAIIFIFGLILLVSKFIFPFFNIQSSVAYWSHFIKFGERGWLQTLIQFIKAIFYLSPSLVILPFLSDRQIFQKTRPIFIFIFIGLLFYLVLFDFSTGALDRYFQFLILPLCLISGAVVSKNFNSGFKIGKNIVIPIIFSATIFFIQFFNHYVPPLHPKTEWISRIFSFKWNFVYPFSGGSGPLGFYISFAFIALFWIFATTMLLTYFVKKDFKKDIVLAFIVIMIFYNGVFMEEYLFGRINGSAPTLVKKSVEFIKGDSSIKKVVVYNDNGGNEIRKIGKYEKRLYTSPQFDLTEKIETINNFSGHYLEIDVPPIDPNSTYRKYLDSCQVIYRQKSGYMNAKVYDCRLAPDLKI